MIILPPRLIEQLSKQYSTAVEKTVRVFGKFSKEEDSITGSLGTNIMNDVVGKMQINGQTYEWETSVEKFGGRGPGALEKKIGADGVIQVTARQGQKITFAKSLPFQAKNQWDGSDKRLLGQVEKMEKFAKNGIVIDYSQDKFSGFRADDVLTAKGNRKKVQNERELGDLLGEDFLKCRIGNRDILYMAPIERFVEVEPSDGSMFVVSNEAKMDFVITTHVQNKK